MAMRLRKDSRWMVYYRGLDGLQADAYFRHDAGAGARSCPGGTDLGRQRRRLRCEDPDPNFLELAKKYRGKKDCNEDSPRGLRLRLAANLIPYLSHWPAANIRPADVDGYVKKRREAGFSDATIGGEFTDLKAISNRAAKRDSPWIPLHLIANFTLSQARNSVYNPLESRMRSRSSSAPLPISIGTFFYPCIHACAQGRPIFCAWAGAWPAGIAGASRITPWAKANR
jgi:hypothetical protein